MDYKVLFQEENELVKERYELALSRIAVFLEGDTKIASPFFDYFKSVADFVFLVEQWRK